MKRRRSSGGRAVAALALIGLAVLAGFKLMQPPAIAPIATPSPASFDRVSVARGAALASIGDCAVCHTATDGASYAGGRAIGTPFGVVYAVNITPDPETGLGHWSKAAFVRAMRQGAARDGEPLYPAFPFDHFTRLSDADLTDLYAFVMTRSPVRATAPANRLIPPLGWRPLAAGWTLLFLHPGLTPDDPSRSPQWNRGRYLAEALGHCAACHTPRNLLGAEEHTRAYAGGWSDGWYAPPLNATSPAARAWTADALYTYLRTGLSPSHAAAAGPMGPVTAELARAPEADVRAIATYIASLIQGPGAAAPDGTAPVDHAGAAARARPAAASLFAGACATCHDAGAPMMNQGRPSLALGTPLREANPRDTLQIVLQGLTPPVGRAGPTMPPFAASLTDAQAGDLAAYLRARYTDQPPWPGDLTTEAAKARKEGGS